jgi:hypothetical protein
LGAFDYEGGGVNYEQFLIACLWVWLAVVVVFLFTAGRYNI